jgi:hypothetical protein
VPDADPIPEAPSPAPALQTPPSRSPGSPPIRAKRPGVKDRLNTLLAEYGGLALWVYFSIFAIVLVGFALAIRLGFKGDSTAATAGTWGAAWVATKLTQPLRIAATLVLTPLIGNLRRRLRRSEPAQTDPAPRSDG